MQKASWARLLLAATIACSGMVQAQNYPAKLITIVVPYPAGGTTDALARMIADKVGTKLGQVIIVENRGGAGGNIGAEVVWRSTPDAYTLLFASPGPLAINKNLYPKLAYDHETFTPVSLTAATPNVLITSTKLALDSLPQLIAYAKAHPDQLNYASQGNGSTSHLTAELFKSAAAVKMVHVPYKGSSPAIMDVLSGQVDLMFVELSSVLQHIRAGTVHVLAVGSERRNPLLPNVPTVSEVLPGFASTTWFALAAPPKTPPALVNKLSLAVADALKLPDVAKRLKEIGVDAIGSSPAQMTQFTKRESARWASVIRILGILPGGGASLASFGAYSLEKKINKNKAEFGKGAIEGVAAPESANNAAAQTSFIPLLTLGIPPNAVMALMVGAMTIHNIQPGPQIMISNPTLFWGLIVSMWFGNLMLVILNLPLIGVWVKLLTVPYRFLYPSILVFCCIGVYTVSNNFFDVLMTAGFGLAGYVFQKLGCEAAPLLLGFVLGPMMEENFRRTLLLSRGDFSVFVSRPLSLGLLLAAAALVVVLALPSIKSKREEAFQEE